MRVETPYLVAIDPGLRHAGLAVFANGVLCSGGTTIRLKVRPSPGGVSSFPDGTDTVTLAPSSCSHTRRVVVSRVAKRRSAA